MFLLVKNKTTLPPGSRCCCCKTGALGSADESGTSGLVAAGLHLHLHLHHVPSSMHHRAQQGTILDGVLLNTRKHFCTCTCIIHHRAHQRTILDAVLLKTQAVFYFIIARSTPNLQTEKATNKQANRCHQPITQYYY